MEYWQEMHCNECRSYFGVHLDTAFTGVVNMHCGICKHVHRRYVEKGHIIDEGRNNGEPKLEILVMRSACYPASRVNMSSFRNGKEGNPEVLSKPMDPDEAQRQSFINELWLNKYSNEV